ncbi:kinase domain-containing protein [Apiospora rasikravindrae]|uniref:Kinase domain-containing protein n=1 Tax=Apiospora rasikravindrae TaxID=990691 RepID=A0ABR1T191_9PEZI
MSSCLCSNEICRCAIEALRDKGMQALLRASQEDASDERLRFVPRESIIREISPGFISRVLRRVRDNDDDIAVSVEKATNHISPRMVCQCKKPFCTGSRVIFASLLFAGLHGILVHFLHAAQPDDCDSSLWKLSQAEATFDDDTTVFHHIYQLKGAPRDLFFYWVYQLRALCFQKKGDNGQVKKLGVEDGLKDSVRLPWSSVEEGSNPLNRVVAQASSKAVIIGRQSAKVERIYIHRSHHNLDESTNSFALKTFLRGRELSKLNFDSELRNNNAIIGSNRVISLEAAFEHRGNFYMVFPWAELGDLRGIWQGYIPRSNQATGQQINHAIWYSPQWLLGECYGIASAVADIHGRGSSKPQPHCLLHADIKAENILGFRHERSVFLKLADFGHSHILETVSSCVAVDDMMNPRSYRAPEYDTQESVTTKYDVWSLGCLFLDFVTWALLGWQGVDDFEKQRVREANDPKADYGNASEDTFFKRVAGRRGALSWSRIRPSYKPTTPRIDSNSGFTREHTVSFQGFNRPVVTQIREPVSAHITRLRGISQLDDRIKQLLDVIENKMLITDCDKRAWSDEVRDIIADIVAKTQRDGNHISSDSGKQ